LERFFPAVEQRFQQAVIRAEVAAGKRVQNLGRGVVLEFIGI
jgi:hypothetical protein